MRVAIISNNAASLISFRGLLIQELTRRGILIHALAPDFNAGQREAIKHLGATPIDYSLSRAGMNPIADLAALLKLLRCLRKLRLDLSLAYFIKPVIYGTIAARIAGIPKRFAMIEGAGHVFCEFDRPSFKRRLLRRIVIWLYRLSLRQASGVFMLNPDDRELFVGERMVQRDKVTMLDGIGVDLDYYRAAPSVTDPICFIFIGRFLREKGIYEFMRAAREVRSSHPKVRFIALGGVDHNPSSVSPEELRGWISDGIVECPGTVNDVRVWLAKANVFVLPSYREGMPRSTQEAMAMGRPVITTDVPGCRETVVDGENGFIVPARNPSALAGAMLRFIDDPSLISPMGLCSRRMAERRFDVHKTNASILEAIGVKACN